MKPKKFVNTKCYKTGTNYVTIKVTPAFFKKLPDGYFYIDVTLEDLRGGKSK